MLSGGTKYNNFFVSDNFELFYVHVMNIEYLFKIKLIIYYYIDIKKVIIE